ncbi:MAG: copper homeostasis protein CutC [Kiritimatiellae bacterium]|nr:copper homeostasis protein CutC [Kiritimatiellia bacterium]
MFLEVCVDSMESVIAAVKGGADRLEVCSSLVIGGLTPSLTLFLDAQKIGDLAEGGKKKTAVNVMLRPRFGDFLYSASEKEEIMDAASMFMHLPDGVVVGALDSEGRLDARFLAKVIAHGEGKISHTLHRAFDLSRDPFEALETAIDLGFDTILTSGQASSALKGVDLLKELNERAAGRITILCGAGVNAENIPAIHGKTGITHYHASAKTVVDSGMKFRREGVPMGLPGISEYEIWRTDEGKVRAMREVLDACGGK